MLNAKVLNKKRLAEELGICRNRLSAEIKRGEIPDLTKFVNDFIAKIEANEPIESHIFNMAKISKLLGISQVAGSRKVRAELYHKFSVGQVKKIKKILGYEQK